MTDNPPQQQQIQVRIDESKMHSAYANSVRPFATANEVILDMGVNIPMQAPNQPPTLVFSIGSRVIMNYATAKQLAGALVQVVRQYEERNGEIKLGNQQAPADGAG